MANYIIIGGDGKEYGPVSEMDVRQWISEGRLNGHSRVKAESDAEFRALSQFPEFAAALTGQQTPAAISPVLSAEDYLDRDYELDIGACITRGWEMLKENFGIVFGCFIIMFLIQLGCSGIIGGIGSVLGPALLHAPVAVRIGFNYFSSLAVSPIMGPLMGGLYLVYLRVIRGEQTTVGEVFSGFQISFLQLFLGSLVVTMIFGACLLPFQFVFQMKAGPLLEQMQHMQNDPAGVQKLLPQLFSAFGSTLPVLLICLLPLTFLTVCFQFTLPLIIDKDMDFATAMKTSMRMVLKHWWLVFGLTVVAGLVSMLGLLGCCIGVIFTAPIGIAAQVAAYETIFGVRKN